MTTTPDELFRDAHRQHHPYDVEVVCEECRDAQVVRFLDGEPVNPGALECDCGGELRP